MKPTTSSASRATSMWWPSACDRTNGPARTEPITSHARRMIGSASDRSGRRISMGPVYSPVRAARVEEGSVRAGTYLPVEVLQAVAGKPLRLTEVDDRPLVGLDLS